MEDFKIFLDIDGVMFDWEFLLSSGCKKGGIIRTFNPESVNALNMLTSTLSQKFNTELVITSTWKKHMPELMSVFKTNGVNVEGLTISKTTTKNTPAFRGREIMEYLGGQKNGNFIIIDDEMFDYDKYFSREDIIKTNIYNNSLNMDMVTNFLTSRGFIIDDDTPSKI